MPVKDNAVETVMLIRLHRNNALKEIPNLALDASAIDDNSEIAIFLALWNMTSVF